MWKKIRVSILSFILAYVAFSAYRDTNHNWDSGTRIVLHPINADKLPTTQKYIESLTQKDFDDITSYIERYAQEYRGVPTSIKFELANSIEKPPPIIQGEDTLSILKTAIWSLKFRFYGLIHTNSKNLGSSVVVYLNYHDPESYDGDLPISTALERGRIALVNLPIYSYGDKTNNVIILHESMHSLGAKDYYDLSTGDPIYPIGYAEPNKVPLYPQDKAELMGGYIPLTKVDFVMPKSLDEVVVNRSTAIDLKWIPN